MARFVAAPAALVLAVVVLQCAVPDGAGAADSEPVRVTASVEPEVATVGDRLLFVVDVDAEEGASFSFPDVAAEVAPFELIDAVLEPSRIAEGRVTERRTFVIAAFETGELYVPSLRLSYVSADGDSGAAFTDSLAVTIESVLPEVKESEEVGPKDIKPPFELPRRVWPYIVAALVAAAAGAGIWLLRRWLRLRKRRPAGVVEEEPRVPRRAAHLVANERLDALEREDPIGRGELALFYVRVTEIVRLYLRDRFDVDAIDMTTSELGPAMLEARIEPQESDWATRYLGHADLAKFAGHEPSKERALRDFAEARDFVDRTRFMGGEDDDVEDGHARDGGPGADGARDEGARDEAPGGDDARDEDSLAGDGEVKR